MRLFKTPPLRGGVMSDVDLVLKILRLPGLR